MTDNKQKPTQETGEQLIQKSVKPFELTPNMDKYLLPDNPGTPPEIYGPALNNRRNYSHKRTNKKKK